MRHPTSKQRGFAKEEQTILLLPRNISQDIRRDCGLRRRVALHEKKKVKKIPSISTFPHQSPYFFSTIMITSMTPAAPHQEIIPAKGGEHDEMRARALRDIGMAIQDPGLCIDPVRSYMSSIIASVTNTYPRPSTSWKGAILILVPEGKR